MIRNEEHARDKLKFFEDKNLAVHITLDNGRFLNGSVIIYKDDSIIFSDEKLGEQLVFLSEIKSVEKRLNK